MCGEKLPEEKKTKPAKEVIMEVKKRLSTITLTDDEVLEYETAI